jgi:hypothetical protein
MSAPAKINIRCSVCGFAVTTPDEIVVGAYCIDDAPCECGYHPDLMSDTAAQEEGYCFNPDCQGHNPVRSAHSHGKTA